MEAIVMVAEQQTAATVQENDFAQPEALRELSSLELCLVGGGLAVASFG
jgi:hypothetical protein